MQVALTSSSNFKVRIAAAQALATVPSRLGFRIPTRLQGGVPDPLATQKAPDIRERAPAQASAASSATAALDAGDGDAGFGAPLVLYDAAPRSASVAFHLAPALQMPGYDAFPTAFLCLVETLRSGGGGAGTGLLEARYRHQLRGSVREALLHLVLLAERLDYGRMKAEVDACAAFLLEWLCAEEALLLPPPPAAAAPDAEAAEAATDGGGSRGGAVQAVTANPSLVGIEPMQGVISLDTVHAAFRALTALFDSRVKTIPKSLLAQFHAKCDALGAQH